MAKLFRSKIVDYLTGRSIVDYYHLYQQTQWYSENEMKNFQINKLKALLEHCYQNVPFYRAIIERNNININDIDSFDVLKNFPVITKETILNNYQDFIPQNLTNLKGVKYSQTGGTTGRILVKRTDAKLRSSAWASFKRFNDWMGISESDIKLKLMGGHIKEPSTLEKLKSFVNDTLFNEYSFDPYDNSEKNISDIRNVLNTKKIKLIKSYSQHLYNLAQIYDKQNQKFQVKAIMTTAEPLMPQHRALFQKIFNAESYDQYGCGEIGGIAYECEKHEGLHITDERVIVEVDENNNLIFTDLDNFAMPYIRYRNDDQAVFSDAPCSCGRKSRLIKQVMGRSCDYVSGINGKNLHWAYFWHLMFDTEIALKRNITKFQVHQVDAQTVNFRTVGNDLTEDDKNAIRNFMFEKLGKMQVNFITEVDIENAKSGKYRPVVNDLLLPNK